MAENENKIVDLERLKRNNVELRNREVYKKDLGEIGYIRADGVYKYIDNVFIENSDEVATSVISDGLAHFDMTQSYYGYWDPFMCGFSRMVDVPLNGKQLDEVLKVTVDGKSGVYHMKHSSQSYGDSDYYGLYPMGGIAHSKYELTQDFSIFVKDNGNKLRVMIKDRGAAHTIKIESVDLGIIYYEASLPAGLPARLSDADNGTYFDPYDKWFRENDFTVDEDSLIDFSVDGKYYPNQTVTLAKDDYEDDTFFVGNMHLFNPIHEDTGVPMCLQFPLYAIEEGHPDFTYSYVRFAESNKQHEFAFGKLKKVKKDVVEHLDDEDAVNGIAEAELFDVATDDDGNVLIAGDNVYGW